MRRLLCAAQLLLASCAPQLATAQRPPVLQLDSPAPTIVAYSQPAIYFTWWQELAECEKLELPLPLIVRVQFYEVQAHAFTPKGSLQIDAGASYTGVGQIFLATPYVADVKLVKHEMLHHLLEWNGYDFGTFHPAEFFMRCGLWPWAQ